ncbi:Protein-associating with the carboxyl-terminal domain of ezrin [Strongyloides ratti]|uniref:Protein-associating with the carboxyl-terminal domain of ezrin n=1 Tax=Strongyloides ratti TaxID=34506 RepID=A0A090L6B5_STRRB|nr:Protein-associating with the carboxyl-terminal domain of ezrin [Strongyloides ratti]CEF63054.1 Protein-associating with the carboxyl-terminal domain of ezrin [Strongyloides ratti]
MGNNAGSLKRDFIIGSPLNIKNALWDSINHCQKFEVKDTKKSLGKNYLIFIKNFPSKSQSTIQYLTCQKAIQNLKLLRHPYILEYVYSIVMPTQIVLVTEDAKDLTSSLVSLSGFDVLTGVYHILEALVFLETKAGMRHNSVCLENIFVLRNCHWVLGGLEYAAKIEDSQNVPKTDIKGFGSILEFCFRTMVNIMNEKSRDSMEDLISKINTDEIVTFDEIYNNYQDAFNNNLVIIEKFLMNLPLKTIDEKEAFFSNIINDLKTIPNQIIGERLLKSFLNPYMRLEPLAHKGFYDHFFKSAEDGGILTLTNYKMYLIPALLNEFNVYEIGKRIFLLNYFEIYIKYLDSETLEKKILPQLQIGLKDINVEIVSKTYKALGSLVSLVGVELVTGNKPKKLFADGRLKNINPNFDNNYLQTLQCNKEIPNEIKEYNTTIDLPNIDKTKHLHTIRENINSSVAPKSSTNSKSSTPIEPPEIDYFADMEPEIEAGPTLDDIFMQRAAIEGVILKTDNNKEKLSSKFAISMTETDETLAEDAWLSDSEDLLKNTTC